MVRRPAACSSAPVVMPTIAVETSPLEAATSSEMLDRSDALAPIFFAVATVSPTTVRNRSAMPVNAPASTRNSAGMRPFSETSDRRHQNRWRRSTSRLSGLLIARMVMKAEQRWPTSAVIASNDQELPLLALRAMLLSVRAVADRFACCVGVQRCNLRLERRECWASQLRSWQPQQLSYRPADVACAAVYACNDRDVQLLRSRPGLRLVLAGSSAKLAETPNRVVDASAERIEGLPVSASRETR